MMRAFARYLFIAICLTVAALPAMGKELNGIERMLVGVWESHSSMGSSVIWRKPDGTFVMRSIRAWDKHWYGSYRVRTDSGRWGVEVPKAKGSLEGPDVPGRLPVIKVEQNRFVYYSGDYCRVTETRVLGDPKKAFRDAKLYFDPKQWDTPDCLTKDCERAWNGMWYLWKAAK